MSHPVSDIPEPVLAALETVRHWMGESGYDTAMVGLQGDFVLKTRRELTEAQSWAEARRNTQEYLLDVIRAAEMLQAILVEHRRIYGRVMDMDASSELIFAASNNLGKALERAYALGILTGLPKR